MSNDVMEMQLPGEGEDRFFSGYRIREEPREKLRAKANIWLQSRSLVGIQDQVSYRGVLKVEDQQRTNSCAGHMGSTGIEYILELLGMEQIQLSRWFSYITGQQISGDVGQDQGTTIYGIIQALQRWGVCPEEFCPFTGEYYTKISQPAYDAAKELKLGSYVPLDSVEDMCQWIGEGKGPIFLGVPWSQSLANPSSNGIVESFSGSVMGGHAILGSGYSLSKELIEIANSHSLRYGLEGFGYFRFSAMRRILAHRNTVCYGVTELKDLEFKRQPVDWRKGFLG